MSINCNMINCHCLNFEVGCGYKNPTDLQRGHSVSVIVLDKMSDNNCIRCNKEVRARQHGIQCDTYHLWQHRTCGTGITLEQYRQAVRGDMQLQWRCIPCVDASGIQANDDSSNITMGLATPVAESSRLSLPGIFHGNMQSFEQDMQMYEATSDGYTYNVKSKRGPTTYWQCTVRNKHTNCKASVTERGHLQRGVAPTHPPWEAGYHNSSQGSCHGQEKSSR